MSINTNPETSKQNAARESAITSHAGVNGQTPPDPDNERQPEAEAVAATPIPKPAVAANMDRFKSKRGQKGSSVDTLPSPLPHYRISDAKDYVHLHPDEDKYWSDAYCFINIPTPGHKDDLLYLIDEDLVPPLKQGKIQRFRLALGSKPNDVFFLCHVPCENLENSWNATNIQACERAKSQWVEAVSQKAQGKDTYAISPAGDPDAFPEPKWPTQPLTEIVATAFGADRMILSEDHPGLIRLVGRKQSIG